MSRPAGPDKALIATVATLLALGMLTLYSAGQTDVPSSAAEIWRRQATWVGIGIPAAFLTYRLSPRILEWATPAAYVAGLLLLVLTLLTGTGAGTAQRRSYRSNLLDSHRRTASY